MRCGATILLCIGLYLVGCEAEEPCDKDQSYSEGTCSPKSTATPDAGSTPADKDSGSEMYTGDGKCMEDEAAVLGHDCKDDSGCNCAAAYCAIMPGAAMGYCTVHCHPTAMDCPSGYRCFDLSAVGVQGIEPFCIKN